ncbi:hypothetical protein GCM10020255_053240 [Rhodococcus baikonurensis]
MEWAGPAVVVEDSADSVAWLTAVTAGRTVPGQGQGQGHWGCRLREWVRYQGCNSSGRHHIDH